MAQQQDAEMPDIPGGPLARLADSSDQMQRAAQLLGAEQTTAETCQKFDLLADFAKGKVKEDSAALAEKFSTSCESGCVLCDQLRAARNNLQGSNDLRIQVVVRGYPQLPSASASASSSSSSSIPAAASSAASHPQTPAARCNLDTWYRNTHGKGALKYSPVACSAILDRAAVEAVRARRGNQGVFNLHFRILAKPSKSTSKNTLNKIVVVPSVGCPERFKEVEFCKLLHWGAKAQERLTYLVIHQDEEEFYSTGQVANVMQQLNVGIISWKNTDGIYGFGMSRFAAQWAGMLLGSRNDVLLMDHGVVLTEKLSDGYETDNVSQFRIQNQRLEKRVYLAVGRGNGIPSAEISGHPSSSSASSMPAAAASSSAIPPGQGYGLKKIKQEFSPGRPAEQVVIVDHLLYDPCFVTSSEDVDLTNEMLWIYNISRADGKNPDVPPVRAVGPDPEPEPVKAKKSKEVDEKALKAQDQLRITEIPIRKVDCGSSMSSVYSKNMAEYLKLSNQQNDIFIEITDRKKNISQMSTSLAAQIAKSHNKAWDKDPTIKSSQEKLCSLILDQTMLASRDPEMAAREARDRESQAAKAAKAAGAVAPRVRNKRRVDEDGASSSAATYEGHKEVAQMRARQRVEEDEEDGYEADAADEDEEM